MKTKVTLSFDKQFVEEAKAFARTERKSLSALMEESLTDQMVRKQNKRKKLTAHKRLSGAIKRPGLDANTSLDELRYDALKAKYDLP